MNKISIKICGAVTKEGFLCGCPLKNGKECEWRKDHE